MKKNEQTPKCVNEIRDLKKKMKQSKLIFVKIAPRIGEN